MYIPAYVYVYIYCRYLPVLWDSRLGRGMCTIGPGGTSSTWLVQAPCSRRHVVAPYYMAGQPCSMCWWLVRLVPGHVGGTSIL